MVQAYFLLTLPLRRRHFESLRRASERVQELDDPEHIAAIERIHEEEGVSVGGCLANVGFVLVAILFAVACFVSVWHFVATAAPPALAETAGWLGFGVAVVEVATAGLIVALRREERPPVSVYGCVLLAFAVPFAIVYAAAPAGVVLYAASIFILNRCVRLVWDLFSSGRVHILIGFV